MRVAAATALTALLVLASCAPRDDLADGVVVLPKALREVSGIVALDAETVACVQDERGAIYVVDLRGETEMQVLPFGRRGDYEGIAWTGSHWWILRSDGVLLKLEGPAKVLSIAATHPLPKGTEYEGLCFDAGNNRLLVMPKQVADGGKKERDLRRVFAFDLATERVSEEPVVMLQLDDLIAEARASGFDLPVETTKKGRQRVDLKLRGSELLRVPDRDELLLLSAVDHLLVRVDFDGRLLGTHVLDQRQLPQPEAMAFLPDGRLLIASEGVGGPAVIRVVGDVR